MYQLSPTRILYFLYDNFSFLELLYRIRKEDDSIVEDDLSKICNESQFDRNKLFEYGILVDQLEGNLVFNINYKRFIEFLLHETNLSLPERWANQTKTINEAFAKLQITSEKGMIIRLIRALRETISEFICDLQNNLKQLLKDTEAIKGGDNSLDELTHRIIKARDWINFFVKPLNDILDSKQDLTIIRSIKSILDYSNYKKFEEDDYEIRMLFEQLYFFSDNINKELNIVIKHLSNELIPLLRRIESNSMILKGLTQYLQDPFAKDDIPVLARRRNHSIYSSQFFDEASLFLDQFRTNNVIYFEDIRPDIDDWIPDSERYKELLVNGLPIINFYEWCLHQLQAETGIITLNKFISLANLIHEKEIYAEFTEDKFVADLSDAIITLPKVKIYATISDPT